MKDIYIPIIILLMLVALYEVMASDVVIYPYRDIPDYSEPTVYYIDEKEEEQEDPCSFRYYPDF